MENGNEMKTKERPADAELVFGRFFTDHMLEVEWDENSGWSTPKISPFHNFNIHPAAKVFHYALEVPND
jgi:branched-chain amino acid aminotransferase